MNAPTFDLACIGRAAVDLYGEQIGAPLEATSSFARYLGGSPANTAVGAARLGLRVAMITRVGDEQNGRFVRATLEREGVDVSQVTTDPKRLTALVFLAIRDRDDFPHVFYRDNCADMAIAATDVDVAFLARCRALLVSGTHLSSEGTRAACERAIQAVRAGGGRIALDIDYRPVLGGRARPGAGAERAAPSEAAASRLAAVIPHCDLVVGTEEEFRVAGGSGDTTVALRNVRARTRAVLVLKQGPRGCIAFEGAIGAALGGGVEVEGFPVEVFNVLGAGDAFMAGFLRGWLRGDAIALCCRYANGCGAIVVSRHGCAPAMPTAVELAHFLEHGPASRRLREDTALAHLHHATTRRPRHTPLLVLAFDHRSQLESAAGAGAGSPARIAAFKSLVAEAFLRVAGDFPGAGVILDERYGGHILPSLTGRGFWIGRPVEAPGSVPVEFEGGEDVSLVLRAWPTEHVAKCLVYFHPDDAPGLQAAQCARLATLARACAAADRELLIEVIPPAARSPEVRSLAGSLDAIYRAGIRPDWWKLPPQVEPAAWEAVGETIARHDPLCRGILVLGLEAAASRLREAFAAAARCPWVRGFAVGRSIFAPAAEAWFAGRMEDAAAIDDIARRYEEVIGLWASRHDNLQPTETA